MKVEDTIWHNVG